MSTTLNIKSFLTTNLAISSIFKDSGNFNSTKILPRQSSDVLL